MHPSSQRIDGREEGRTRTAALGAAFGHLEAGRLADAERIARALAKVKPPLPGFDYLNGLLALARGNGRKAAQHLLRACQATPAAVPPRLAFARAQAQQGRLDAAAAAYRVVSILAPDVAEAYLEPGIELQHSGRHTESLPHFCHAVRLQAPTAPVLNHLGIACRAHGDLPRARLAFRMALVLRPDGPKPYANLAGIIRVAGEPAMTLALRAATIDPRDSDHWIEAGQSFEAARKNRPALAAYRKALLWAPGDVKTIWLIAAMQDGCGEADGAIMFYQRLLALVPDDPFGAGLALAHRGAVAMPAAAPPGHLRALYDQYAASFDANLVGDLAYRGPAILVATITQILGSGPFDVLDLGCGTGLAGIAMRPWARRLEGVDLSPRMVDLARQRGVYDDLFVEDMLAALAHRPAVYDLLAAADVLIYQGDLTPTVTAAAGALRPGGAFVFTVEASATDPVALLPQTGRFAHSADHLRTVAAAAGMIVRHLAAVSTRREAGRPVPGLCCLLQKP